MRIVSGLRLAVRGAAAAAVLLGAFGLGAEALAADQQVIVGQIEGAINPITSRYVARVIAEGERSGTPVLFVINTPGGLISATYEITGRMLAAQVPVITFVAPQGARAASAGTFITMAGHVAAMAPATNIGAAHPVDSSGANIESDLRQKAENDAVAHITNIARARGRNVQWAEDAVRKSVSARVDEALSLNVIDLEANDVADLLGKIDGRTVKTAIGETKLATRGAAVDDYSPNPFERVLHFIVDPQVAVLLFTVGTYGLIFELSNPGLIFPGIVGVIAIILALFAFGTLDANGAGIALMVFAVVLFVAEIKVPSHGLLTAGGIASLLIGTIIVFPPFRPTFPGFRYTVDPAVLAVVVGTSALFFGLMIRAARDFLKLPVATGPSLLVGALGVAKSEIAPSGIAHVAGEDWTVVSEGGAIATGAPLRVRRVDGVRLIVEPAQKPVEARGGS